MQPAHPQQYMLAPTPIQHHHIPGAVQIVPAQPRPEQVVQRKRPKYTRSKTGCLTCRGKKIKVCRSFGFHCMDLTLLRSATRQSRSAHAAHTVSVKCVQLLIVYPQSNSETVRSAFGQTSPHPKRRSLPQERIRPTCKDSLRPIHCLMSLIHLIHLATSLPLPAILAQQYQNWFLNGGIGRML